MAVIGFGDVILWAAAFPFRGLEFPVRRLPRKEYSGEGTLSADIDFCHMLGCYGALIGCYGALEGECYVLFGSCVDLRLRTYGGIYGNVVSRQISKHQGPLSVLASNLTR